MNESIYDGIPEDILKPDDFAVYIKQHCDTGVAPLAMIISGTAKDYLDDAFRQHSEEEAKVVLTDHYTGFTVGFCINDIKVYFSKPLVDNPEAEFRDFADTVSRMVNEGGF
ncbi:hypothetical protein BN19_048 [Streptococcus phage SP-QS1]|uniref:Uncharacterized protein n=1 Tax=Streptococcus phage SP-QS1 TaxID=1208587 RepID=S6CUD8_9CAUD|nr:hypothetical protein BN19_048 [Streptococcus phage SP-QS1]CCJ09701.1 hypothetical protein BN19_048 [Streptococcus phage SP-QS1]